MTAPEERPGPAEPARALIRDDSDTREVVDMHEPIFREMEEPRDGFEPTPLWLLFFSLAVVGFSGWYLGMYSAGFNPSAYAPSAWSHTIGPAPSVPTAAQVSPEVLGKRVYNNCMACHQREGTGVPGNYPPLDGSNIVLGPPDRLAALVLHGLQGPVDVKGVTYDNQMPSWAHLTDDQIAAVLTYVRSAWSNQAPPISPELVASVRNETSGRAEPWTIAELERFGGAGGHDGAATGGAGETSREG